MKKMTAKAAAKSAPAKKSEKIGAITCGFKLVNETKGALRFEEDGFQKDNMDATAIGTLYMRKSAFPDGDYPKAITVTINM